jgi:hypothetical protein
VEASSVANHQYLAVFHKHQGRNRTLNRGALGLELAEFDMQRVVVDDDAAVFTCRYQILALVGDANHLAAFVSIGASYLDFRANVEVFDHATFVPVN